MNNVLKSLWEEWQYGRGIIIHFLEDLSEEDLIKVFPRNKYNNILAQCNELYEIQQDYFDALETKNMDFAGRNLNLQDASKLAEKMKNLDNKMFQVFKILTGEEEINWFGEKKDAVQHICAMIGHEQMHIGQIVAFCYAVGIRIPDSIIQTMS